MNVTYLLPVGSWFGFSWPIFRALNSRSIGLLEKLAGAVIAIYRPSWRM